VGILSSGATINCVKDYVSIFTRVSTQIQWIRENSDVSEAGCTPQQRQCKKYFSLKAFLLLFTLPYLAWVIRFDFFFFLHAVNKIKLVFKGYHWAVIKLKIECFIALLF
jgi:hypothetical protein